jgi:hypothetical protein
MRRAFGLAVWFGLACSAEPDPGVPPPLARSVAVTEVVAPAPALAVAPAPALAVEPVVEPLPVAEPEVAPTEVPDPDDAPGSPESDHAVPELLATAREVFVLDRPSAAGKKLGYLRAGARLARSPSPAGFDGCPGGFYRVAPEGYVCTGPYARPDLDHPLARLGRVRPDRSAPLPYAYVRSGPIPPNYYTRLPDAADLRGAEPEFRGSARLREIPALAAQAIPDELSAGRTTPAPYGRYEPSTLTAGRALPDSSFALLESYASGARSYALSADYLLLATDRLEPIRASSFHGLALDELELPVAFAMRRGAQLYTGHPKRGLGIARALGYREALPLSGQRARLGGTEFREVVGGDWIRDDGLLVIEPPAELPSFARDEVSWLWISIRQQSLVAYRGRKPVYVTLVSTGADGAGDPKTSRSTVQGEFRIHTKHVTARMDSDDPADAYDHRDVPWVAYFSEGYALHAAYWHDAFGTPKSHGCVNLSPADARWLFQWTEPAVPLLWHGAIGAGTRLVVAD